MSKNPIFNALCATLYIIVIVLIMNTGSQLVPHPNRYMAPIAVVSLFTLSAAVMGYIFCYQPIQLYFDGKKKQAVGLFLNTTFVFAGITALLVILMFSGVLK